MKVCDDGQQKIYGKSIEDNGFDKDSNDPLKSAYSESEHLEELCLVRHYLSETLSHHIAKNELIHDVEGLETSSVPDVS